MPIVRPSVFSAFSGIVCGLSTRLGGVSAGPYGMNVSYRVGDDAEAVARNRTMFLSSLGIREDRLAVPQQEHTAVVRVADRGGRYDRCDALITNLPGLFLSVSVADCTPVFLYDPKKRAVACIHAGWRGTEQRIAERALETMHMSFGSESSDIVAYVGPSAGVCCYVVGDDVSGKFDEEFVERRSGRHYLNIKAANQDQLRRAGVAATNIEMSGDCTICKSQDYHSYRRDREKSGRMMGIIGMRPEE